MYRKTAAALCGLLLLGLTGCARSQDGLALLNKDGIAPYELSEEDRLLLQSFGISDQNAQIIAFRAPEDAITVNFNIYVLADGEWAWADGGGVSMDPGEDSAAGMEGIFTMLRQEDGSIDFHISDSGSLASYESSLVSWHPEDYPAQSWTWLQEFQESELNTEIPVAILSCTDENALSSCRLEEYFTPEQIENPDLVQAVTLEFTDKNPGEA